jgi:hypothetical protein
MDKKKIITNIAICIICLSLPALVYLNIYQHRQVKKFSNADDQETSANKTPERNETSTNNIPVEKNITKKAAVAEKTKTQDNKEAEELKYQLIAAKEELDSAKKQLSDKENRKSELLKKQFEFAKKQSEDPASKESWRNISKTNLDRQYALLLKMLKLSTEKEKKIMDILLDEDLASKETGVDIMDDGTGTKRVMNYVRSKDPGPEYQTKIAELLGADDYEKYKSYKEKSQDVRELTIFNQSLGSNDKLTDEQQFAMLDAMYEGAEKERSATVIDKNKTDITAEIKDKDNRVYNAYIKAAENILNSSQLEYLKNYLEGKRNEKFTIMSKTSSTDTEQDGTAKKTE